MIDGVEVSSEPLMLISLKVGDHVKATMIMPEFKMFSKGSWPFENHFTLNEDSFKCKKSLDIWVVRLW